MAKKGVRTQVKMESTEGTGTFYVATKSKHKPEKMEAKKYDPKLRKHVVFKETKMK